MSPISYPKPVSPMQSAVPNAERQCLTVHSTWHTDVPDASHMQLAPNGPPWSLHRPSHSADSAPFQRLTPRPGGRPRLLFPLAPPHIQSTRKMSALPSRSIRTGSPSPPHGRHLARARNAARREACAPPPPPARWLPATPASLTWALAPTALSSPNICGPHSLIFKLSAQVSYSQECRLGLRPASRAGLGCPSPHSTVLLSPWYSSLSDLLNKLSCY